MYITINNIKGEKRIDLSYSIQNFNSDKEIAVIRMLSDNVRYEISNISRAIIKKLAVKFEGSEIMRIDDFDVLACYRDLWYGRQNQKRKMLFGKVSSLVAVAQQTALDSE